MGEKAFHFSIDPWSVIHENKEYQTPIFNLLKRKMKLDVHGDEQQGDFYVLDAPDWVNVIPLTEDDEVILVEQFRYGTCQPTLEIPGGIVDPGENPREAIERELAEETGYRSESWTTLGKVSANPAIMSNFTHLYLAENCRFSGFQDNHDPHERIHVHKLPLEEFLDLAENGTVHHTIVLAAVGRFLLQKRGRNEETTG